MTAPLYRENEKVRTLTCSCPTADDCIEAVLVSGFRRSKRRIYTTWHPALYKLHIQEQWIEGDRLVWNHFGTEGPRTTNNIEAMHGKLKRNVQHTHPNIFTTIQTFKEIQNSNDIKRI